MAGTMGPVIRQAAVGGVSALVFGKVAAMPAYASPFAQTALSVGFIVGELVATCILGGTPGEYAAASAIGFIAELGVAPMLAASGGPVNNPALAAAVSRGVGALGDAAIWGSGINAAAVKV